MTESVTQPTQPRWQRFLLLLAIFAAVVISYLPTLPFSITNWDDNVYIRENPLIRVLDWESVREIFRSPYFLNYHPLTILSYAIDYHFSALDPAPYRLVNILFHAGSAALVAVLAARLGGWGAGAAVLALWWAVTPLRSESVVWLSQRKDVLSVFFYLAAFLAHARAADASPAAYFRRTFPVELAFITLALLSKSMAVTYVAAVLLHDVLFCRSEMRGRIAGYAAFAALGLLFSWANVQAQTSVIVGKDQLSRARHFVLFTYSPAYYLGKSLVPINLSPIHPLIAMPDPFGARHLFGLAVTLALAGGGILAAFRRLPGVALGIGFYFITLAPVSGLVPFGGAFVSDRYSYLPTVGLALAAAAGLPALPRRAMVFVPVLMMVPILLLNPERSRRWWQTSQTLWQHVYEVYPEFPEARLNIAQEYFVEGRPDLAAPLLEATPEDRYGGGVRRDVLFRVQMIRGDLASAEQTISAAPERVRELGYLAIRREQGRFPEAIEAGRRLLAGDHALPSDWGIVANLLIKAGRLDEARTTLDSARGRALEVAAARGQLVNMLGGNARIEDLEAILRPAEAIDPAQYDIVRARAIILSRRDRPSEGVEWALRLLDRPDLEGDARTFVLGMLGYFHQTMGRDRDALAAYREAVASGSREPIVLENAASLMEAAGDTASASVLRSRASAIRSAAAPPP